MRPLNSSSPTPIFWNFLGFSFSVLSIGCSWSLIRSADYKLTIANHKLEVSREVDRVKAVSEKLTEDVKTLPLPEATKKQALDELEDSKSKLEETTEKVIEPIDFNRNHEKHQQDIESQIPTDY